MTAGESHGRGVIAILDGMVSGLSLSPEDINKDLARRQVGYGRGGRMAIEKDKVEIISGVRNGRTIGAPIGLFVANKDYRAEDSDIPPHPGPLPRGERGNMVMTSPRPGHADLAGAIKYDDHDLRNILERASARETAARVAVGSVCKKFLKEFGIKVLSWVTAIGGVELRGIQDPEKSFARAESSEMRCPDRDAEKKMRARIKEAMRKGESIGGIYEIVALGVPPGLGSHTQWDRRLDGGLARALMSIQAIKAVEIGRGIRGAGLFGSQVHDEIFYSKGRFYRKTNNAGGLEGGMTNGENLVLRAFMKPIPTLGEPLRSVDIATKRPTRAQVVRHDVCAVPAASVVGEGAVAFELAGAFLEKFGGDSMRETRRNFKAYIGQVKRF